MPRPITHPDEVALALGMSSPTAGGWGADVEQTQLPTTTLSSRDTRTMLSSDNSRTEVSPRGSPQRDVHIEKARALALGEDLKHDISRHADKKEVCLCVCACVCVRENVYLFPGVCVCEREQLVKHRPAARPHPTLLLRRLT